MKKGFMSTAKKAQIALAVLAAVSCSFISAGSVSAEDTVESLATRVAALESKLSSKTVVIGKSADTSGSTGVAIGYKANAGYSAVAIGSGIIEDNDSKNGANAVGEYSIAIGAANSHKFKGATSNGTFSVAMLSESTANGANSVALGRLSTSNGNQSYALGYSATTNGENNYAIGREAKTNTTWREGANCNLIADNKAYNTTNSKNWKTGTYDHASTDDTTGVTTYYDAENNVLGTNAEWKEGYNYDYSITKTSSDNTSTTTYYLETTDKATSNTYAIGTSAQATGGNALAIGTSVKVTNKNSTAIGNYVTVNSSGSIGIGSSQDRSSTTINSRDSIGIGNGVKVGGDKLNDASGQTPGDNVAIGTSAEVKGGSAASYGAYAKAQNKFSTALGSYSETTADYAVALGHAAKATAEKAVAIGYGTQNNEANTVAVGNRQITQVSAGTKDSDAVNLRQVITDITYDAGTSKLTFKTGANQDTWREFTIAPSITGTNNYAVDAATVDKINTLGNQLANYQNTVNDLKAKVEGTDSGNDALANRISALEANQGTATGGVDATGEVKSDETNAVSGGNLYSELRPENGTYVKQDSTTAANLTALDAAVKANADTIGTDDDYGNKLYNISNTTEEKDGTAHATSIKENLGNLDKAIGDADSLGAIKDLAGNNIGGTKDEDGDYTGIYSVSSAITTVDGKVGDLAENGNNIVKGQSVNANLASLDSAVGDTSALADTIKDVDGNALTKDKQNVAGYLDAVNSKVGDLDKDAEYSNIEAGASLSDNLASLDSAVGTTNDGAYVSAANSVGANLNALDSQVATNTKAIARVNDKVNKVGAGAAALAALHPLDFNPDEKLTFAAGFGNYMGENAVAVGAFYRPNEDVMFSVAGNMGNGENMVNAGVSFALGSGSKATTSKAVMAKKIEAQNEQIGNLTNTVEEQSKEIAELKAMVQALAAK